MGYLYTLEDIRRGRIPSEDDFVHLHSLVEDALQEPHFLAGSLFGSLPRGDWTLRSDIDVMAVARQADHVAACAAIEALARQAAQRHVYLSAHLHTVREARRGEHPFDSSHRLTMRQLVAEGQAKGLPHQWYLCPGQDIRPDMLQRLCRVLASTSDTAHRFDMVSTDQELDVWIRQSWESGSRPLRLYLGFVRWLTWWKNQAPFPDGKRQVLESFLDDASFASFHAQVMELHGLDREYDDLFEQARNGHVRSRVYRRRVHAMLSRALRVSVDMISRAIGRLGSVLAGSPRPKSQMAA